MWLSEIIYQHLNIDGRFFPHLPQMSPIQKTKAYFVNKINYGIRYFSLKMLSTLFWFQDTSLVIQHAYTNLISDSIHHV